MATQSIKVRECSNIYPHATDPLPVRELRDRLEKKGGLSRQFVQGANS